MSDNNSLVVNKSKQIAEFREDVMPWIDELIQKKSLPSYIKTPEDAFMVIQQGKELGIDPATSLNNIHIINGKINLSAILVNGLLQRHQVYIYVVDGEDCIPCAKSKDDKGREVITDWKTTLELYRKFPDGFEIKQRYTFKYSDAKKAGLIDKDVWVKWKPQMMYWRSHSILADRFAADVLMGANIPVKYYDSMAMDDKGNPTINFDPNNVNKVQEVTEVEYEEIKEEKI